ncbi:MAG: YfiR family protein [Flavobacteriales bacterium]|nr:YfiR family protein [Flavobacteriales bacterium]
MLKRLLICLVVTALFSVQHSFSQSKEQVYAGIIFHIMKYVEWPGNAEMSNMTVGVLNDNQLTAALNKVAQGKRIVFKDIQIVKFAELTALKNTNILFIPQKMTSDLGKIMDNVNTKEILVISEKKKKEHNGASINFVEQGGRMRFEVYEAVFAQTALKMSEQLKKYAIIKA